MSATATEAIPSRRKADRSVDAYKTCQQRIEAVEKALEKALNGSGVKNAANAVPKDGASATKKPAPDSSKAGDDDSDF